jgi:hypothetical protein
MSKAGQEPTAGTYDFGNTKLEDGGEEREQL